MIFDSNNVQKGSFTAEMRVPVCFSWEDVCISAVKKTRGGSVSTPIIKGVSGVVEPGEHLAIMGPSGSGKTTLLDCLTGRKFPGLETSGKILLNGHQNTKFFRRYVAYVMDNAPLMGIFTVFETILFSAMCNLPNTVPYQVKIHKVDTLISQMGLENCRNTRVGDIFIKGLSSGQKRRLSIACELVTNPSVVFLDEPTSGLDSAAAMKLMEHIVKLCNSGYTIICTIHQPSSDIWAIFDKLLLLTKGEEVFFGKAADAINYFSSIEHDCPEHYNPADYFLQLINTDFEGHVDTNDLVQRFKQNVKYQQVLEGIQKTTNDFSMLKEKDDGKVFENSFIHQFLVLSRRNLENNARNPGIYGVRLAMYIMLSAMVGFMYWNLGDKYDYQSITSRISLLFYVAAFLVFMSVAVLPFFIMDRAVFLREQSNGYYGIPAYVVSQFITSLPGLFLIALISTILVVLPAGLNGFGVFLVDLFLSLIVAENMMMVLAALVPHYIIGIALAAGVFGFFMLCEGFLIIKNDIPPYFIWGYYMAFHTYSFRAFMTNEFKNIASFTTSDFSSGEAVLSFYDMNNVPIWKDLIVLVGYAFAFQLLFILILMRYNRRG